MARASTFDLHDRIVGGDLADRLHALEAEGHSAVEIAYRLRPEVVVSPDTVRRWLRALDAEDGAA